jgi:hypothetical protein
MMKKLFAVASVTALTGLVSSAAVFGCASEDPDPRLEQTPADGGTDTKPPKTPVDDGGGDDAEPPPKGCVATKAINATQFPYAKAHTSAGACTADEARALSDFFATKVQANEKVVVSEWAKTVSQQCGACVFSDGTGDQWTPIIVKNDALLRVNRGGCIELQSGKEACGQDYQRVTECRLAACGECQTDEEFSACLKDSNAIFSGPCKDAFDALTSSCGSSLTTAENACRGTAWTFEGPIEAQCVTGVGSDGG